jgi:hypothetical protein
MYKNLSEEKSRMQKLMGFIYEYNSHDILSEQVIKKSVISEATQGCEQMIFKGNEINVENFGSILKCDKRVAGGDKFWAGAQDGSKQYILNTLKQKYGKSLLNNGISTVDYRMKKGGTSYTIVDASWSGIKRGNKPGTGGYYLTKNNEIYLINGSDMGLKNGFNNYNDVIKKLNEYNGKAFIKNGAPKGIGGKKTVKGKELLTPEGGNKVYQRSGYSLIDMEGSKGIFLYYPLSGAELHKTGTKPGEPEITPLEQRKFGNQHTPFADNDTVLKEGLYSQIVNDLKKLLGDESVTIKSITIDSSASNLNTSYKGNDGQSNYENNKVLAKDRGESLYERLRGEFGEKLPPLTNNKVNYKVEPCSDLDKTTGRCDSTPDENQKYVWITYNGIRKKPTEVPVETNKANYVYTQWRLQQKR